MEHWEMIVLVDGAACGAVSSGEEALNEERLQPPFIGQVAEFPRSTEVETRGEGLLFL